MVKDHDGGTASERRENDALERLCARVENINGAFDDLRDRTSRIEGKLDTILSGNAAMLHRLNFAEGKATEAVKAVEAVKGVAAGHGALAGAVSAALTTIIIGGLLYGAFLTRHPVIELDRRAPADIYRTP